MAFWLLLIVLGGYMLFNKSFAYIGFPPVYIGEVALGGLFLLWAATRVRRDRNPGFVAAITAYLAIGLIRTVPNVGQFGIVAFRDAVIWLYSVFALLVYQLAPKMALGHGFIRRMYAHLGWPLLMWTPLAAIIYYRYRAVLPAWPANPSATVIFFQPADYAVHLMAIAAWRMMSTGERAGDSVVVRDSIFWIFWAIAAATTLVSRASLLIYLFGFLVVASRRWRSSRLWVLIGSLSAFALIMWSADVEFQLRGRSITVAGQIEAIASTLGLAESTTGGYETTQNWRLQWWREILGYGVFGEFALTGKGFGVNLAVSDGITSNEERGLRSPHNAFLTVVARGGLPLFASFVILLGVALRPIIGASRHGDLVSSWVLIYAVGFLIDAAFGVALEGPQVGIWFWSVLGFGVAASSVARTLEDRTAYTANAGLERV